MLKHKKWHVETFRKKSLLFTLPRTTLPTDAIISGLRSLNEVYDYASILRAQTWIDNMFSISAIKKKKCFF